MRQSVHRVLISAIGEGNKVFYHAGYPLFVFFEVDITGFVVGRCTSGSLFLADGRLERYKAGDLIFKVVDQGFSVGRSLDNLCSGLRMFGGHVTDGCNGLSERHLVVDAELDIDVRPGTTYHKAGAFCAFLVLVERQVPGLNDGCLRRHHLIPLRQPFTLEDRTTIRPWLLLIQGVPCVLTYGQSHSFRPVCCVAFLRPKRLPYRSSELVILAVTDAWQRENLPFLRLSVFGFSEKQPDRFRAIGSK